MGTMVVESNQRQRGTHRRDRHRGRGDAAPGRRTTSARVVRRDHPRRTRPACQTHLQPVPPTRRDRDERARRLRARRCDQRRPRRPHRRRPGHVHLRGPSRRDPALWTDPVRGAAAAHDHPRRSGHRPRHRVDLVPQRAATRVGPRDGHLHRVRRGRDLQRPTTSTPTSSRPSPTPTARSATPPGCASSSSRSPPTWRCATSGSPTRGRCRTRSRRSPRPGSGTASASTRWTAPLSSPGSTT